VSFPLRCGKEDPHKQDVLESTVYAGAATADSDATMADAAAASAVTPSAGTAATPASPSLSAATVPLFAPYSNVLRPLPHVHVENRFYIQRQLDEDDKRVMQERTKLSEQEAKQQRSDAEACTNASTRICNGCCSRSQPAHVRLCYASLPLLQSEAYNFG
jgi:hypothetical protein